MALAVNFNIHIGICQVINKPTTKSVAKLLPNAAGVVWVGLRRVHGIEYYKNFPPGKIGRFEPRFGAIKCNRYFPDLMLCDGVSSLSNNQNPT